MDIMKYDTIDIETHLRSLWNEFQAGIISTRDYWALQPTLIFRDDSYTYWYYDPIVNTWYQNLGEGWQVGSIDSDQLEGLEGAISMRVNKVEEIEQIVKERELDTEPADLTQFEALVDLTKETKKAYQQGLLTASDVNELLTFQCAMDDNGRIWAFGVRSENWFYFEDGEWCESSQSPDQESLLKVKDTVNVCQNCGRPIEVSNICPNCSSPITTKLGDVSTVVENGLFNFLILAERWFPEEITAEWDPPENFEGIPDPEITDLYLAQQAFDADAFTLQCSACGAANLDGSRFCNQCGAALGCINCGTINRAGNKYCWNCGSRLPSYTQEP